MALKQVYNSRSKRWVLLDDSVKGGIKDMSPEKFEDVPVKGEADRKEKFNLISPEDEKENKPVPKDESESSRRGGWLDALGF
jgi:hypothetical protein